MPEPAEDRDATARRLSAGIARGDRGALDEFYRLWFGPSLEVVKRLTGRDESFCLDAVQEAMLRVVRKIKPMTAWGDVDRWMQRVLHTAALDLLRRESRRAARERRGARESAGSPVSGPELADQIAWVRARLAELPAADGWLVWLRLGRGRTLKEAGAATGMSGDAAHGRIRRTVQSLRQAGEAGHE